MKLDIDYTGIATRSGFIVPTSGGTPAGVCPQTARLRVDGHAKATFANTGAVMGVGHRSWSPLIT
jgi:hypothetical protein